MRVISSQEVTVKLIHDDGLEVTYVWTFEEAQAIKDALIPMVGAAPKTLRLVSPELHEKY